ncbi:MAG: metallophosphoesterase family protein [Candidatus Helarchaeales archaeon]
MTRVLFGSDFHGNKTRVREFFSHDDVDIFVIGGDLFSIEGDFRQIYKNQANFANEVVKPLIKGLKGKKVFMIPGNNDVVIPILKSWELMNRFKILHQTGVQVDSYEFIGFGFIPPSPFPIKNYERRDLDEIPKIKQLLKAVIFKDDGSHEIIDFNSFLLKHENISSLLQKLPTPRSMNKTIFVMHSPPHDTKLDFTFRKEHVGSRAIRFFIEEKQFPLFLCGHIHEADGIERIGETTCANCGSKRYVSFEINDEIENLKVI